LSLCPDVGSVRIDGVLYRIFCFAEARHARWFAAKYDGVSFLPLFNQPGLHSVHARR
jgi:hypothetical protein